MKYSFFKRQKETFAILNSTAQKNLFQITSGWFDDDNLKKFESPALSELPSHRQGAGMKKMFEIFHPHHHSNDGSQPVCES